MIGTQNSRPIADACEAVVLDLNRPTRVDPGLASSVNSPSSTTALLERRVEALRRRALERQRSAHSPDVDGLQPSGIPTVRLRGNATSELVSDLVQALGAMMELQDSRLTVDLSEAVAISAEAVVTIGRIAAEFENLTVRFPDAEPPDAA